MRRSYGWIEHAGPVRADSLSRLLGVPTAEIDGALLRLEASGTVLRGKFSHPPRKKPNGATAGCWPAFIG